MIHHFPSSARFPVSVLIPHLPARRALLDAVVLPCLHAAGPAEILIDDGDGHPCAKRNALFAASASPLVMFYDDDIVCEPDALESLVTTLNLSVRASLAYSDFVVVNHPIMHTRACRGRAWDAAALADQNFIPIMALVARSAFLGFDEGLTRYQDWDLWLRMAAAGHVGVYVPRTLFTCLGAIGTDWPTISRPETVVAGRLALAEKHGIGAGL